MNQTAKTVLIELHYFPCVAYFTLLSHFEKVCLEYHENFQKQSYRNRCVIMTANGPLTLTVPVKKANSGLPIGLMEIDNEQEWQKLHWRTIQTAYGKSPFFEFYSDYFRQIIHRRWHRLIDLNREILSFCLKLFQFDIGIEQTKKFVKLTDKDIVDYRSKISAKISGSPNFFAASPYNQVFGNKFVSNLSVIDLLFCEGPGAMEVIRSSISRDFEL